MQLYELEPDDSAEQVPQVFYNKKDAQSIGLIAFVAVLFIPIGTIFIASQANLALPDVLIVVAIAAILEAIAAFTLIFVINAWRHQHDANRPRHRAR